MATGQSLLDTMEVLNAELQLQAGEQDVAKGLLALNVSQDWFETQASLVPQIFGSLIGEIATTQNVETTIFPAGVMRIDKFQLLTQTGGVPKWNLTPIEQAGEQANTHLWPYNLIVSSSTGAPGGYWTNGTNVYWAPVPDAVYYVRYYGFKSAADITAGGAFAYPDQTILPIASFAVSLIKLGLDDPLTDANKLAQSVFSPVIQSLSFFRREGGKGFNYRYRHDT